MDLAELSPILLGGLGLLLGTLLTARALSLWERLRIAQAEERAARERRMEALTKRSIAVRAARRREPDEDDDEDDEDFDEGEEGEAFGSSSLPRPVVNALVHLATQNGINPLKLKAGDPGEWDRTVNLVKQRLGVAQGQPGSAPGSVAPGEIVLG